MFDKDDLELLETIVNTPSPPGWEKDLQNELRDYVKEWQSKTNTTVNIHRDNQGNQLYYLPYNNDDSPTVLICAHCDQIGFLISKILDEGFLKFEQAGGLDQVAISGVEVCIATDDGEWVSGVTGKKPTHFYDHDEDIEAQPIRDQFIDIGASSKEEAEDVISLSACGTFQTNGYIKLLNNIIAFPGVDNKICVFVLMLILKYLMFDPVKNYNVILATTTQEELNIKGALALSNRIDSDFAIVLDVTHALDNPSVSEEAEYKSEVEIKDGSISVTCSPINNWTFIESFEEICDIMDVNLFRDVDGEGDHNEIVAFQYSPSGMATIDLGIPVRYMHTSVETVHLGSVKNLLEVVLYWLRNTNYGVKDFIPK